MPLQMRPSVSGPRWRIGRRGVLQATAAAVTGAALAGCGPRAAALRPAVVQTKIRLVAQVSWQGGTNFPGTAQELTDQFVATHWTSKHPGVEVRTEAGAGSNGPSAGTTPTIASVLAGAGPDIVVTCCSSVPTLLDSGILAPLNPLLKKDNVDTQSLFPASVLDQMTRSGVIYGLPDYGSTGPLFVNYSALDELGLPYPQPDWTAAEAETLWRSLAGRRNGKWVFGANLPILSGASAEWLVHGWGGAARTSGRTRCLLDSTECTSAYTYIADLAQAKVINPCLWCTGSPPQGIEHATIMTSACCGTLEGAATSLRGLKWDILPMPRWPAGSTTFIGNGMYGINQHSKNPPALVWELYKFLTLSLRWQKFFNAQLALQPPPLLPAQGWDDWMQIVRTVAPPLARKHLEYYRTALDGAYGWGFFRYQGTAMEHLWQQYNQKIFTGQLSPQLGLRQLAAQINALQQAGHTEQISVRGAAAAFPTAGPTIAKVQAGL